MSFRTSVSGMNAANTDLNVTAHNIANVNTTGFKQSRAEFGDLFAVSSYGLSRSAVGAGVRIQAVAQQFAQGNIDFTGRSLDMAISGQGFFTLSNNGSMVYSRAGNFGVDRDGYVVNPAGHRLQVFQPNASGGFDVGRMSDLRMPNGDAPPLATNRISVETNLPADAPQPALAPFDPLDPTTYNYTTAVTVYDSLGGAHNQSMYFVKTANPNEWEMYNYIDGAAVGGANLLTYSSSGELTSPAPPNITLPSHTTTNGSTQLDISLDLGKSTQYGEKFSVQSLSQNGYTTGRLTDIEISSEGVVSARYTNGVSEPMGQIAMTNFVNHQGLQPLGDNVWAQTYSSGEPRRGQAMSADFGMIQGGGLEASNVDLTEQLVNMITAQRNFQANAQMISTQDQIMQTVINIR